MNIDLILGIFFFALFVIMLAFPAATPVIQGVGMAAIFISYIISRSIRRR